MLLTFLEVCGPTILVAIVLFWKNVPLIFLFISLINTKIGSGPISWAFLHTTEADVRSERERWQGHTWIHPTLYSTSRYILTYLPTWALVCADWYAHWSTIQKSTWKYILLITKNINNQQYKNTIEIFSFF